MVDFLFDTSAFCHKLVFISLFISQDSSLNISSGGTKFKIFCEHVGYLHFVLLCQDQLFD